MPHAKSKRGAARQSPSYESIGSFYDAIWIDNPPAWTSARARLLAPALSNAQSVCELGCGTGITAVEFARRGLQVFALDYSREMCRITREKAAAEGLAVRVVRGDMRTFRLPAPVDLLTSEWGVINHLRRRNELVRVFRAIARALKPGGYLYFDLHQRKLYEDVWSHTYAGDGVTSGRGTKFFAAQRGGFDREREAGWTEIIIFARAAGGKWVRRGERVEEIYWPHGEIVRALRRAGLVLLRLYDFADVRKSPSAHKTPRGTRTMYLARKKSR